MNETSSKAPLPKTPDAPTRESRPIPRLVGREFFLTAIVFASMGAIAWAVRGTGGWGGIDGTVVPGMMWGVLWYYVCRTKGLDPRTVPFWLGFGISLGGELGYGQYVSWIRGLFNVGGEVIPVAPWLGYLWFAICGAAWAAPGAIFLGWALHGKASIGKWALRISVPVGVAALAYGLVNVCPGLFFPNHHLGIYDGELCKHLDRTVYTNTQNFVVFAWWVGAVALAFAQRDRETAFVGTLLGAGFAVGFMVSAIWCLGYAYAPQYIDWWKMWELFAGFFLGILCTVALRWAIPRMPRREGPPSRLGRVFATLTAFSLLYILFRGCTYRFGCLLELYPEESNQYAWPPGRTALFAPMAAILIAATLYHLWGVFFPTATPRPSSERNDSGCLLPQKRSLQHGDSASLQAQKRSPFEGGVGEADGRCSGSGSSISTETAEVSRLSARMVDMMMLIGCVGAITIWPAKIAVLYAAFLLLALSAFARLRNFNQLPQA